MYLVDRAALQALEGIVTADSAQPLVMYGTTWCPDCHRSKRFLDTHSIPYEWINVEEEPKARKLVRKLNRGANIVPTIVFPDGRVLAEPSDQELGEALGLTGR